MKKLFLGLVVCAVSLLAENGTFPHLNKLPKDSLLRSKCESIEQDWAVDPVEDFSCNCLNSLLANQNTDTSVKNLVRILLANESDDIKSKEYNELMSLIKEARIKNQHHSCRH